MSKSEGALLRTDTQGRVRTPAARREVLLDEFERSGLSGAKFAALAGIKYQTFAGWAARRRKQGMTISRPPADPVRWLEVVADQGRPGGPPKAGSVPVQLPGGARIELADATQIPLLAALVRALERNSAPC